MTPGATTCETTGKLRFKTKRAAARHGAKLRVRQGTGEMRVYRCAYCHGFHLTSGQRRAA